MKLLICATILAALPLAFAADAPLAFEVASVKAAPPPTGPGLRIGMTQDAGRVTLSNVTLINLLTRAYKLKDGQISGPDWLRSERYDVVAKLPAGANKDQIPEMLQTLLKERFQLKVHTETKVMPVYALVAAKSGAKLHESQSEAGLRMSMSPKGRTMTGTATTSRLADVLSGSLDRPVIDLTGITTNFDIDLSWTPDENERGGMIMGNHPPPPPDGKAPDQAADGTTIFDALQEKLGLRLDARKSPVELLIVDHAEKVPSEN